MTATLESMQESAEDLQRIRHALAEQLRSCAESIHNVEQCRLGQLAQESEDYNRRFCQLNQQVSEVVGALRREDSSASLDDLTNLIAQEGRRLDRLGEFETLLKLDASDERFKDEASAVRSEVAKQLDALRKLDTIDEIPTWESEHPLSAIRRLLNQGDSLTHSQWEADFDLVRTTMNRNVALAVARGRVCLTGSGNSKE